MVLFTRLKSHYEAPTWLCSSCRSRVCSRASACVHRVFSMRAHKQSCTSAWGSTVSPSCSLTGPTAIWSSASVFLFHTVISHVNRCFSALWQQSCDLRQLITAYLSGKGCESSGRLSTVIRKRAKSRSKVKYVKLCKDMWANVSVLHANYICLTPKADRLNNSCTNTFYIWLLSTSAVLFQICNSTLWCHTMNLRHNANTNGECNIAIAGGW